MNSRQQHILDMLMMKWGAEIVTMDGEKYYDFKNFDMDGFQKHSVSDAAQLDELLPANLDNELDFSGVQHFEIYRNQFIRDIEEQERQQNKNLSDGMMNLLLQVYSNAFNDGANYVVKILTGEIKKPKE